MIDVDENSGVMVLIKGFYKNIWMVFVLEEFYKIFNDLSIKEIVFGKLINVVGGLVEFRFDNVGFVMNVLKKIYLNWMDMFEK